MNKYLTKNEKINNTLIETLSKDRFYSLDELMFIIGCSKKSIYNHLNKIKNENYNLEKKTINHKAYYHIIDDNSLDSLNYISLNNDVIRKYSIVQVLQNGPKNRNKFIELFSLNNKYESDKTVLDINRTYFYQLIKELKMEEEIMLNSNNEFYLTGKDIPIVVEMSENDLLNSNDFLYNNLFPQHPYYSELKSIFEKQNFLLGNFDNSDELEHDYLIYGCKYINYQEIKKTLHRLNKYDYKHKILNITYKDNNNTKLDLYIAVGLIVYVSEKDRLYILGKSFDQNNSSNNIILNTNNIVTIKELDKNHDYYQNQSFLDLYENMFSISIEDPFDVEVEFDNIFNILRKLKQLKKHRKNAQISVNNNIIVYTDRISGLHDFANYLRQYGRSCKVIRPLQLKEIMNYTINKTLKRYEEEINNE